MKHGLLFAADLQKSMSGIAIDESCVNLFMHMKTRKQVGTPSA